MQYKQMFQQQIVGSMKKIGEKKKNGKSYILLIMEK